MSQDPRIVALGGIADEAAAAYKPGTGVFVGTDRERQNCVITITAYHTMQGGLMPDGVSAHAFLPLTDVDALIAELQVCRADLLKLAHKPSPKP